MLERHGVQSSVTDAVIYSAESGEGAVCAGPIMAISGGQELWPLTFAQKLRLAKFWAADYHQGSSE